MNLWKALENYTSEENSPEKKILAQESCAALECQTLNFPDNGTLYQHCLATLLLLPVHSLLCTDLRKMRLHILQIVCSLPITLEPRVVGRKQWRSVLRLAQAHSSSKDPKEGCTQGAMEIKTQSTNMWSPMYSRVPNKWGDWNKQGGWKKSQNLISRGVGIKMSWVENFWNRG